MVRLVVRLTPRATVERVDGVVDGSLRCRVTAPPVEGAANEALVRLLARELGLPRSAVTIASGATGRTKLVEVEGPSPAELRGRWPGLGV